VMLVGRCGGTGNTAVHVSGVAAGERVGLAVPEANRSMPRSSDALPKIWARMKIAELLDEATYVARPSLGREIRDLALEYGLISDFTSFIAVDASGRTVGSEARTFPVPVPVPSGVSDQTTTEER
jgi:Ca-activated chloride channel family protein